MNRFFKLTSTIDNVVKNILNFLLVFLVVDVCWQVLTRFVLPEPSSYTEEIARFLLIWIGLLGAAHAYRHKMHLGIDFFVHKLAPHKQKALRMLVLFLCAIFAICVFIIGGINLARITLELKQHSAALGVKMGYIYFVLPITGVLIVLYTCELLFQTLDDDFIDLTAQENKIQ